MINWLKKFFKELKRVRWPTGPAAASTFFTSISFIIIGSVVLFGVAIGFTTLWSMLGVGLNG